jgi:glycosyltransferase involved in cell wall biosynthesis
MKIINLAYTFNARQQDPVPWIHKISFFNGILFEMATLHQIMNVELINYTGVINEEGVEFHFPDYRGWKLLMPFKLNQYVGKLDPDIIIIQGIGFSWQVMMLRLQIKRNVKIIAQHRAEKPFKGLRLLLQRIADRFIKLYFFSSAELARPWIEKGMIKSADKIEEVLGVSSGFGPADRNHSRKMTGITGSPAYLWIGRLDLNKNPVIVIKAFLQFLTVFPEATLSLIFQSTELLGPVQQLLNENAPQAGSIRLVGEVSHDHLPSWYSSSDFIISSSYYESNGAVVCEGMSCGCIPILSNIPSFRMITGRGNCGLLFDLADNVEGLANTLVKSARLNLSLEREKTLRQFNDNLSFSAIARKMIKASERISTNITKR